MAGDFEWLRSRAFNVYSQDGEDGILAAIFSRIGDGKKWCLECGASDGLWFSNTRRLIERDWNALLIEADHKSFARLEVNSAPFAGRVSCVRAMVDSENCRLDDLLKKAGAPKDIDLAVIDVDGQDYYLFNSLLEYEPRVVVVEYEPRCDPDFIPALGADGQAGWNAICRLAAGKLYAPIMRNRWNMVLVKRPLDQLLSGAKE